jgi:FkbM family methyltransferase
MFRIKVITQLIHINENIFFYPKLRKFYKKTIKKQAPVILDVGVNKGQTIDFFLGIFKECKIYGFEPNRELCNMLWAKYKGNKNIKIFNYGVSDINGKLVLNETVTNETSTFEDLNYDSEYLKMKSKVLGVTPETIIKAKYEVDVVTLASFLEKEKVGHIDVLKIDTEGHEYKCLLGLFNGGAYDIDFIQLEQHNDDMYSNKISFESIDELLNKNEFKLFEKIRHGFGDFEEIVYANKKRTSF